MLDFSKISEKEFSELKQLIKTNSERSEIANLQLFTNNLIEKTKIYIYCYRLLSNAYNILDEKTCKECKETIKKELDKSLKRYNAIQEYLYKNNYSVYGQSQYKEKIFYLIQNKEVDDLIDIFSILLERINVISISRMAGVYIEGKSAEEFKKIMESDKREEATEITEDFSQEQIPTQNYEDFGVIEGDDTSANKKAREEIIENEDEQQENQEEQKETEESQDEETQENNLTEEMKGGAEDDNKEN